MSPELSMYCYILLRSQEGAENQTGQRGDKHAQIRDCTTRRTPKEKEMLLDELPDQEGKKSLPGTTKCELTR